jgi:hypothetical protein
MTPAPSTAARSILTFRAFAPDDSLVVMWSPGVPHELILESLFFLPRSNHLQRFAS